MPERYTDVNIKLHQYQGWESRGLRVLGGFKETVLVAKGKQTEEGSAPKAQNRDIIPYPPPPQFAQKMRKKWSYSSQCFSKLIKA